MARFVKHFNKCLENDNNVVESVAFICKSNPVACAGNNYRMLSNAKNELTIEGLSVWNERCCKLNDSINVIKEMVDVRDEFKECQGFSREEVKGFIEMLCIDWLFLTSLFLQNKVNFYVCTFFTIDKYYYVFLKCVNKDIIIKTLHHHKP